jgi:hypothetical protein
MLHRLIAYALISTSYIQAFATNDKIPIIAFGDARGYFEPCGCDPKTDLGGLVRLSGLIARERRDARDRLILGLGNNFELNKPDLAKDQAIIEALAKINVDAMLFNRIEISRQLSGRLPANSLTLPYILSNWQDRTISIQPSRQLRAVEVFGFVEPNEETKGVLQDLESFIKDMRKHSPKQRVLLYSGSKSGLEKLVSSHFFIEVIASNSHPITEKDAKLGQISESELMMSIGGRSVFMVPYGGQGVLRYGPAMDEPRSLAELLSNQNCAGDILGIRCADQFSQPRARRLTWLTIEYQDAATIRDIYLRYQESRRAEYERLRIERLRNVESSPYIGDTACASCHAQAHSVFLGSKHAKAFEVLVKSGKNRDPECVSCHVVGFDSGRGFVDIQATPHLANVQCENCHGPRREHASNPSVKGEPASLNACVSCHYGQHSPDFNQQVYWQKISHGKN